MAGRLALAVRLATRDFGHDWRIALCQVLGLAAVLAPLLVLFGLRFGLIDTLAQRLIEDPRNELRYDAACAAALVGCGRGEDGANLDNGERTRWRAQALDWLRQDLTAWGKRLDQAGAATSAQVRERLRHWKGDPDLAGIRAKDALAGLPNEERQRWERLWSDVGALLRRVSTPE